VVWGRARRRLLPRLVFGAPESCGVVVFGRNSNSGPSLGVGGVAIRSAPGRGAWHGLRACLRCTA
jgi:hypothetical protein